jgi:hypothetical protein
MESFIIKPILGLKTNVPQNDPSLFQMVGNSTAVVHAVGGENFDLRRNRNACTKSYGKLVWSANGIPTTATGSNLITNGAAWTGATGATPPTGWSVVNAGTFTITDSGDGAPYDACLKIEVDDTPTENPTITDAITTVSGKTYRLSYAFKHGDGTSGLVYVGTTSGGNELYDSGALTDASWTTYTYDFKASSTTTYITLITDSAVDNEYELFDTVTLYELGPPTNAYCLGMIEATTGGTTHRWAAFGNGSDEGTLVRYDSARYPQRVSDVAGHSGAVQFASGALDYYSMIDFGGFMIFADRAETTPYCCTSSANTLSKLVDSGTEYKVRYLETFQNRIIGAYVDTAQITDGDISIIWTGILPTPGTSCTFGTGNPPTNHLFRPNDDPITAIKKMGMNACYLYGENSIDRIDYYPNYTVPYGITNRVVGAGFTNQQSIVDVGGRHLGFDRNYGFCEYRGGVEFPYGGRPISESIEEDVASINPTYFNHITGSFIRQTQKVYWSVPAGGSATPSKIFAYDMVSGGWEIEDFPAYHLNPWVLYSTTSWQDLIDLGYSTWDDFGTQRWGNLVAENPVLVLSNSDGKVYMRTGESDNGSAFEGYRIEPIVDFGSPEDRDLLLEIWFSLSSGMSDYNIHVWHRSGDTVGECENAGWDALTDINCNSPANPVIYLDKLGRYHQIKWGTDGANETFQVNSIEFKYVRQGRY